MFAYLHCLKSLDLFFSIIDLKNLVVLAKYINECSGGSLCLDIVDVVPVLALEVENIDQTRQISKIRRDFPESWIWTSIFSKEEK